MPVAWQIPLQAGKPSGPFGPDLNQVLTLQGLQVQLAQQQREQQGLNALAQMFRSPDARDPATGLFKPEAINQLGAVAPEMALQLHGVQAQEQERLTRANYLKSGAFTKYHDQINDIVTGALSVYDQGAKTMPPDQALQRAQEYLAEQGRQFRASGVPPEIAALLPTKFDPVSARAMSPGYLSAQTKEKREEAKFDIAQQEKLLGNPIMVETPDGKQVLAQQYTTGPNIGQWVTADKARDPVQVARPLPKATPAEYGSTEPVQIIDKDGNVVSETTARESKIAGHPWLDSTGNPLPIPEGGRVLPLPKGGGAGRQQAAQVTALTLSANEVTGALRNLVDLPSTSTAGWFSGVQREHPEGLKNAIVKTFANKLTPDDAKAVQISFAGIQRGLATLDAGGRAQGLVGLSKMFDVLMPKEGDSQLTVLRSYAEIRQVVERAADAIKATSTLPTAQKKALGQFLDKVVDEAKSYVPWTVRDVNALQRAIEGGNPETIAKMAEKLQVAGREARDVSGVGPQPLPGAVSTEAPIPPGMPALAGAPVPRGMPQAAPAATPPPSPATIPRGADGVYQLRAPDDFASVPPGAHFRLPQDPPGFARLK